MYSFSKIFIDRPVLASVMSLLIVLVGLVSIFTLPVDRFPNIVPPSIQISASYSGADAETVAESVATPIEQQLSSVANLLYFSSQSGNDGSLSITATFEVGADQDIAAVEVQNRVNAAVPRLPEDVIRGGITVGKSSAGMLAVIALESDDPRYDDVFLSNYAIVNVLNAIRREPGVGNVSIFGSKSYSMRVWLDPEQLTRLGLTVAEVISAIRDQNDVYPSGSIGQRPTPEAVELTIPVQTRGRLTDPQQYANIILRGYPDGRTVRLKDVAEIELGSLRYELMGRVNSSPTAILMVSLQDGANALETIGHIRRAMDELSEAFPPGVEYRIPYDTTTFIEQSITEVVKTLFEAVLLVLLVVFVFLQSWRATLIPLIAIPVSIIGAFAGMLLLGFSINTLTLFGLVLAIGIVVDDAIVVVENVERLMDEEGLSPRDATVKAMSQVSGALVAMVLVLCAVFVPVAFLGGLTGALYQQFAVTIAISVAISGFVALTLSPALCRLLLRPRDPSRQARPFKWFNAGFGKATDAYTGAVRGLMRRALIALLIFGGLGVVVYRFADRIPTGFIPQEDQGFLLAGVRLPDGASLDRTDDVIRRAETFLQAHPAVQDVVALVGYDQLAGGVNSANAGAIFISLKPFSERGDGNTAQAGAAELSAEFEDLREGVVLSFLPPAVQGIGQRAGFQLELQDRSGAPLERLVEVGEEFLARADDHPGVTGLNATLRYSLPQLFVDVDREQAKTLGINLADIFQTMRSYLGAVYINDFNMLGRIWRVQIQAQPQFRDDPSDIESFYVRSSSGAMVPLSGLVSSEFRAGPNIVEHFNGFRTYRITGVPAPGRSSGEAMQILEQLGADILPPGFAIDWSGASFQERRAARQAPVLVAFALVVILLVLAGQYERWLMPFAVILVVPFAVFGAMLAIFMRGLPQDIYFQIGLLVLVGLSAKNAILIVEFCMAKRLEGLPIQEAAAEAARIRFRPILMTSLAFVMGVVPLVVATGAGAAARHSIGTGVIGGMLAATFLAPLFVPLFFSLFERLSERIARLHAGQDAKQPLARDLPKPRPQ
ncbi:MAG: multidrug efflux RND transporter permease subunit [Phycisphaerales bacterium]|nr:multidrug efflux RND transporter permease subunit [Phycisphaerales bacterium]